VSVVGFAKRKTPNMLASTITNHSMANSIDAQLEKNKFSKEVIEIYKKLEQEWKDRISDKRL